MSVQETKFERELDEIMMLACRLNNLVDRAYQYEVGYDWHPLASVVCQRVITIPLGRKKAETDETESKWNSLYKYDKG